MAANNLYNATLFRVRQVITGVKKNEKAITPNEKEILDEIFNNLPQMNKLAKSNHDSKNPEKLFSPMEMPTAERWLLSYNFVDYLYKASKNIDYFCSDLPRQSAQQTMRQVFSDMKSFFGLCRQYREDSSSLSGKPRLPHYHKKGGCSTVIFTNQDCKLKVDSDNLVLLKFPLTKMRLCLGTLDAETLRLKQVTVTPTHGVFAVSVVVDDGKTAPEVEKKPERICAIDFGVNNIAAISNNIGKECLLFKGGAVKSANQWYNKKAAAIVSAQTKGDTKKFVPTPEYKALILHRNNIVRDFMHKTAKAIIAWCVENNIDTIVVGKNNGWKQNADMGKASNQKFVMIPFDMLRRFIKYRAEREGIRYIEQEESYTSKASFPDNDYIPVFGEKDTDKVKFSGKRRPTRHKGMYKKDGFRGLYTTSNGDVINSDLNGAANIGRKALPEFDKGIAPDFTSCIVIVHPDLLKRKALREKQKTRDTSNPASKSKQRRLARKKK